MITIKNAEWVTDLTKMTCRNTTNNIVILFKKVNGNFIGKIKNLPVKIVKEWAAEGRGNICIKNMLTEAEIIFYKAYMETKSEKCA